MLDAFASVAALQTALDYHLERHNLLVSNIAHVDTPGYRPVDLARETDSFGQMLGLSLKRTDDRHLATNGAASGVGRTFTDPTAGAGPDGNYVSLDREAAKVAANQMRYDVISAVASSELRQLVLAASDGRGA